MKSFAAAIILSSAAIATAQPGYRAPMVPAGQTRQLSPHTWAIEDKDTIGGLPNIGYVVGSKGILVIDTGMGRKNGTVVYQEALKLAPKKQIYLVTTHVHPEHDLGAEAFPPDIKMIRSNDEEKDIAKNGYNLANAFINRNETNRDLLTGAKFRKADIHFDKEYDLDLGGVTVHLTAQGPDHTIGDTVIWVPADKVLFSGDLAMKGMPAFLAPDSSLNHWLITLSYLASLHPAIVVPSHGPIGDASYITNYQAELTTVRARTRDLKKEDRSLDQVTTTLINELGAKYPDKNRLAGAIYSAYHEAP